MILNNYICIMASVKYGDVTVDTTGRIWSVNGLTLSYVSTSINYTVLKTDSIIDFSVGGFVATLPTALNIAGKSFWIKNSGVTSITVNCSGVETIDGIATKTVIAKDCVQLTSNGANWILTANYNTASGGGGLVTKSGVVAFGSFSGNPDKATVTFATAFTDANYSISIIGENSRAWSVESVLAGSFIINSNANTQPSANTYWTAIKHGESL